MIAVFIILAISLYIAAGIGVLYLITLYEIITNIEEYELSINAYPFMVILFWPISLGFFLIVWIIDLSGELEKAIAKDVMKRTGHSKNLSEKEE